MNKINNLYSFKELDEEIQNKVLEQILDIEFECFYDIKYLATKCLKHYFSEFHAEYAYFYSSYDTPYSSEFKILIDFAEYPAKDWKNATVFKYGQATESFLENYFKMGIKKINPRRKLVTAEEVATVCTWNLINCAAREYDERKRYVDEIIRFGKFTEEGMLVSVC